MHKLKNKIWIFCTVIDNFGDIGIAYRLARELARDQDFEIYLVVDDLVAFSKIENKIQPSKLSFQNIHAIQVIQWQQVVDVMSDDLIDAVIEMFGCFSERNLDYEFSSKTLIINLEYLSAEAWTLDFHLKPSMNQSSRKFFFFLGFNEQSGGLLIEQDYRQSLLINSPKSLEPAQYLAQHQIVFDTAKTNIFLFGYPSEIWQIWFENWKTLELNFQVWALGSQNQSYIKNSNPNIMYLPFVNQTDFDQWLQFSDIIIVRGEDSFVRAQLTGKPFFWHIYPQSEQAHLKKLQAFWDLVEPFYDPNILKYQQLLSQELNQARILSSELRLACWRYLLEHQNLWQQGTLRWQNYLFSQSSAYEKLTQFIKKQLK